ncbi:MAG: Fic/DOC family protein, partial [Advenella sp.]|uniref:Fic/DOC family protein n=1 Tax=Advenella sp. TaxID=1872388 RepID=UPI003F9E0D5A
MAKYSSSPDSYVYPGTDVLINKEGIKDAAILDMAESNSYLFASAALKAHPVKGNFDFSHLKQIHERLFGDLYEWAGKVRTVDISKGTSRFANHQFIEESARQLLRQLQSENYLRGQQADT